MLKLSFKINSDFYVLRNHSDKAIKVLTKIKLPQLGMKKPVKVININNRITYQNCFTLAMKTRYYVSCVVFFQVDTRLKCCVRYVLLVCFVCLKDSTCETKKNVFYFTSKVLFVLEIIKF